MFLCHLPMFFAEVGIGARGDVDAKMDIDVFMAHLRHPIIITQLLHGPVIRNAMTASLAMPSFLDCFGGFTVRAHCVAARQGKAWYSGLDPACCTYLVDRKNGAFFMLNAKAKP